MANRANIPSRSATFNMMGIPAQKDLWPNQNFSNFESWIGKNWDKSAQNVSKTATVVKPHESSHMG